MGFSFFCSGACCFMLLLQYTKGVAKKTYKTRFLATPFLREGKGRQEEKGQRSKKHHHFSIKHSGALKTGRKLFHLVRPPNFSFSNLQKKLYL